VLGRLLPDLTTALNARQAFVAAARETARGKYLEITAAHPAADLRGRRLPWRELFADLIEDSRPRVIDPLGEETPDVIAGLELFNATEAILVRAQGVTGNRVVGICNKRDAEAGPYLASDGRVLDNIIELVAIGARVGERHTQELQSVHRTSTAVSAEYELDRLLPMISRQAAACSGRRRPASCCGTRLRKTWSSRPAMGCQIRWTAADSKDVIMQQVERLGGYQPVFTPRLSQGDGRRPDGIERGASRPEVSAPLLTSGR